MRRKFVIYILNPKFWAQRASQAEKCLLEFRFQLYIPGEAMNLYLQISSLFSFHFEICG